MITDRVIGNNAGPPTSGAIGLSAVSAGVYSTPGNNSTIHEAKVPYPGAFGASACVTTHQLAPRTNSPIQLQLSMSKGLDNGSESPRPFFGNRE